MTEQDDTDEQVAQYIEEPADLADDVIATLNSLMSMSNTPDDAPFDPMVMFENFKPQVRMKTYNSPKRALQACALLHRATGDILDKYAEDDTEKLAKQAMENAE